MGSVVGITQENTASQQHQDHTGAHTHSLSMAWHVGTWWPLAVKEWYTPKASQHVFDPYSFCLVVAGLLCHLLWGTEELDSWLPGFLLAIGLELIWEIIGNTKFVLARIRNNNGTSGEYLGDSLQNILGDLLSCGGGYLLGTLFAPLELWWLSLVWLVLSELACILYMRDSLLLNILSLVVHSDKLVSWQLARVPCQQNPGFIS